MPNLKTIFCHKCGKAMTYPYKSRVDGELYHKWCLPYLIMDEAYFIMEGK